MQTITQLYTFANDILNGSTSEVSVMNNLLAALIIFVTGSKTLVAAFSSKKTLTLDVLPGRTYYT